MFLLVILVNLTVLKTRLKPTSAKPNICDGTPESYIDRHQTGVDTSATGGIAAAIAWGCRQGILNKDHIQLAKKAYNALIPYLSADGFLRQVSQINRGGEDLQKSNYRVITQFGMGLMAQLKAALDEND